jgi:nicotinamidase-related amidase
MNVNPHHPTQMIAAETVLLVVDVQEKLMAKIPGAEVVVRDIAFLIDVARLVDVEVTATEQYPKGLGATVPDLLKRLPARPEKLAFSCAAVPELFPSLLARGRTRVVLVGIEAHVCVLNTALDLLADGFRVYLAADAIASRYAVDREFALRRLEQAGAILTTVETAAFEWIGGAAHPRFKQVSALVQQRMNPADQF